MYASLYAHTSVFPFLLAYCHFSLTVGDLPLLTYYIFTYLFNPSTHLNSFRIAKLYSHEIQIGQLGCSAGVPVLCVFILQFRGETLFSKVN